MGRLLYVIDSLSMTVPFHLMAANEEREKIALDTTKALDVSKNTLSILNGDSNGCEELWSARRDPQTE